jgi:hypothetical protein
VHIYFQEFVYFLVVIVEVLDLNIFNALASTNILVC